MAGLGERTPDTTSALWTADRQTEVTFDLEEVVLTEPAWSETRRAGGITPDRSTWVGTVAVEMLASGWWILRPIQDLIATLHETTDISAAVMTLGEFDAIAAVKQEPLFRLFSEIIGVATDAAANVAASDNDQFFTLRRGAGSTWDVAVEMSRPKPNQNENLVMDRVMEATVDHEEDQGYFLRWQCPGTHRHAPDNLFSFYFGGPLFSEGYGEYCLRFRGDGICVLYEFALFDWHRRKEWQYCPAGSVMNAGHSMRVIPHRREFIEFRSETNLVATGSFLGNQIPVEAAHAEAQSSPLTALYQVEPSPRIFGVQTFVTVTANSATQTVDATEGMQAGDTVVFYTAGVTRTISSITDANTLVLNSAVDATGGELVVDTSRNTAKATLHPNWVTGRGRVKFDVRRDLRLNWQVSRLRFPGYGVLFDHPVVVPNQMGEAALQVYVDDVSFVDISVPDGDTLAYIIPTVVDAQTTAPLPDHGSGTGFQLPENDNALRASFAFITIDNQHTPYMRGYTLFKDAVRDTITPGETTTAQVVDVQITGPTSDPTHESAHLVIEDTLDALTRLRVRGGMSVRIRTRYDTNPAHYSVLFQGYVTRADVLLAGWDEGQEYPDPEWRRLEVQCTGSWRRIQETVMAFQGDFLHDPAAPDDEKVGGSLPPWRIREIVPALLGRCGYPDDQIEMSGISTFNLRAPLETDQGQLANPQGFLPVERYMGRMLQDYLDSYLFFDGNASNGGLQGMWRAAQNPRVESGDTPLWSFTNDEPPAPLSGVTLIHRQEAYPAATSMIERDTFRTYVSPPEGNAILVTALGHLTPDRANTKLVASAYNPKSYRPPGKPDLADPDHPDYLGRYIPIVLTDPLLGASDDPAKNRGILNLFTRRLYNQACRAIKRVEFATELVLIADADDVFLQGRKRPLRFGDFVHVDDQDFLISSVSISYQKDHIQEMFIEAEGYRAPDEDLTA